jgi:hypothetical protein
MSEDPEREVYVRVTSKVLVKGLGPKNGEGEPSGIWLTPGSAHPMSASDAKLLEGDPKVKGAGLTIEDVESHHDKSRKTPEARQGLEDRRTQLRELALDGDAGALGQLIELEKGAK